MDKNNGKLYIGKLASHFNSHRMMHRYVIEAYL
jgi:hypothetical protein